MGTGNSAMFETGDFLRELSAQRDNLKRCELVRSRVDSIVGDYGLNDLVDVSIEKLNSVMVQKGLYNIVVSVPDARGAGRKGQSLDELFFSCHTDAINMSLRDSVGPGMNDNGSGAAVLLHDLEDNLIHLSEEAGQGRLDGERLSELPRTTYLFFSGEEGSLKGVGVSGVAAGLAYAFPGVIIGQMIFPGLGALVPAAYSLVLMESMSRSSMFNPGLCGSYSWAMGMDKEEIAKPKALVNFDMVGNYAPSVDGGLKGLIKEMFGRDRKKGAQDSSLDNAFSREGLRTVVVPDSNIGTSPSSWVIPIKHDLLSPSVGEAVYAQSVKGKRLYNVRNQLSLGSSDHASAQQVSDKRGGNLRSAMMIGLGGMEPGHEIHTGKDNYVDESDLEFSCMVAESIAENLGREWKNYSQVSHLEELSYAGLFSDGKEGLALARCYDAERDQWVNLYFRVSEDGMNKINEKRDTAIRLLPEQMIDWDLKNDIARRGVLKNYEGYTKAPSEGTRLEFCGNEYALIEAGEAKRRWAEAKADAARFLSDRQIIPMLGAAVPITSAVTGAGVALAGAVSSVPLQAAIVLGAGAASLWSGYQIIKIPLRYSNVVGETIYDLEAERANSQLCRAVRLG